MDVTGDAISQLVLERFEKLPKKRKPRQLAADGGSGPTREWVPLAGIVVERQDSTLECVALGTGMKCLPAAKVASANGSILHDWHAEIVALRAFNRFLLEECRSLALSGASSSAYIRRRRVDELSQDHSQPFTIREDVKLHMYCSEAPCGDASMELTMAAQDDATPWAVIPLSTPTMPTSSIPSEASHGLPGRAYFSSLGVIRRKPSRPDAPPTLSKSCSDKIALKQATSVLSCISSLLFSPEHAYLQSITLPESQYVPESCGRCFSAQGRFKGLKVHDKSGYKFQELYFLTTKKEFQYSRRDANGGTLPTGSIIPSNIASAWNPYVEETIIGGVLQGRKQNDPKGASAMSRRRTWELARTVTQLWDIENSDLPRLTDDQVYQSIKEADLLRVRRDVKSLSRKALGNWIRNEDDEKFKLGT